MSRFRLTPSAESHVEEIYIHIATQNSPDVARRVLNRLYESFLFLGENPLAGRDRTELATGLRSFPVEAFVIVYEARSEWVEILGVYHGAQNYEEEF